MRMNGSATHSRVSTLTNSDIALSSLSPSLSPTVPPSQTPTSINMGSIIPLVSLILLMAAAATVGVVVTTRMLAEYPGLYVVTTHTETEQEPCSIQTKTQTQDEEWVQPSPLVFRTSPGYVSPHPSSPIPAVCLSHWEGRFGNHIYQSMFLLTQALRFNFQPYFDKQWEGWELMQLSNMYDIRPCPSVKSITRKEPAESTWGEWSLTHPNADGSLSTGSDNTTFVVKYDGYFQLPTSGYSAHRQLFQQLLQPKPWLKLILEHVWYGMLTSLPDNVLLVAIHIRHADMPAVVTIPNSWYYSFITRLITDSSAHTLSQALQQQQRHKRRLARSGSANNGETRIPLVQRYCGIGAIPAPMASVDSDVSLCILLLSDDAGMTDLMRTQKQYAVVTSADVLSILDPSLFQVSQPVINWFADWWFLSQCVVVASSHSTFSQTAMMINIHQERGVYFHPDSQTLTINKYDPWNDHYRHLAFKDAVLQNRMGNG